MKENKIGAYLIRLSISVLIAFILVAGGTWAYWQWSSTENKSVVFNTVKGFEEYVKYDPGESHFVGNFRYTNSFCDSPSTTITVQKTRADIDFNMTIRMDINSLGESISTYGSSVSWVLTQGDSNISCSSGLDGLNDSNVIGYGNFAGVNAPTTILLTDHLIPITTVEREYTIWIWINNTRGNSHLVPGETIDVNIWSQIDMGDVSSGEAYALVYEVDTGLYFRRSETPITVGSVINGREVAQVYTGFETDVYEFPSEVPWRNSGITEVYFEDSIHPVSTRNWFNIGNNIDFVDAYLLDTSKVTDMSSMFISIYGDVWGIDFWDTSNVTNVEGMFHGAYISDVDLSYWNVCNVENYAAFYLDDNIVYPNFGNPRLCQGDIRGQAYAVYSEDDASLRFYRSVTPITSGSIYDGKTVTNVYTGFEFNSYESFTEVPWYEVRDEITSIVFEDYIYPISTRYWFCSLFIDEIDVLKLDTSNVTDMEGMFEETSFNNEIDLSGWNVCKVTNYSYFDVIASGSIIAPYFGNTSKCNGGYPA